MLKIEFACFVFTLLFGALFRKMYFFSHSDFIVGFFFPVNSSTWENLKLLFFSQAIFFLPQYLFFGRYHENFLTAKIFGICAGMLTAIILHIILFSIFKYRSRIIKVFTFFLSAAAAFIFTFNYEMLGKSYDFIALSIFTFLTVLFFLFTYHSPKVSIFSAQQ
jgi:hypothetical protein